MNRSTCASGSAYVPSVSIGFWVARTRNGSGTLWVSRPIVTWRSCITSSSALWTLAGARLISSASSRFVKTGPERGVELAGLLVVDPGPDEVGRDEVRRELDALEVAADRLGERLDGHRLGQAGHALDEQVAAGQEGDDHPLEQVVLADDDLLDLVQQALHRHAWRVALASRSDWHPVSFLVVSTGGRPAAPPATSMGTARPMPMKTSSLVGLTSAVTMPDDLAVAVEQRPAGVARVDGGVDLDEAVQRDGSLSGSWNDRPRPETTPALSEPYRPNGLPTTNASLPIWTAFGLPSVAGTMAAGGWVGWRTAMSCSGWRADDLGGRRAAVGEGELDRGRVRRRRGGR